VLAGLIALINADADLMFLWLYRDKHR